MRRVSSVSVSVFSWTYMVCPAACARPADSTVEECTVCFSLKEKSVWESQRSSKVTETLGSLYVRTGQTCCPSVVLCCVCLVSERADEEELSLVCHMKHCDEKRLKTKTVLLSVGRSAAWESLRPGSYLSNLRRCLKDECSL